MRTLRINLCDGKVALYGERTYQQAHDPRKFWDHWNSHSTRHYWHRTELDRDGNPYTVKWHSVAFRNGRGAWMEGTMAMEADGEHPACIRPAASLSALERPKVPTTQRGRLNVGERLASPIGTWTVTESWVADKPGAQSKDRDYKAACVLPNSSSHVRYLLTHHDGHQEEWSAPDMADAGFHRVLPDEQQKLI